MERESAPSSLSSFFTFDRKQVIVLLTIISILITGALYIFLYIPSNRRSVESIHFRAIQNIDSNMGKKVDNSAILLNQILQAWKTKKDSIEPYIRSFPKTNFKLDSMEARYLPFFKNKADSARMFLIDRDNAIVLLQNADRRLQMKYSLHKFIEPLLSQEAFDHYLILGECGEILYQTFPSGATAICPDSLDCSTSRTESVRDIRLGGTDYKIFFQRINLDSNTPITIAGLLKRQKYQHMTTSLPENFVVLILFIVLALILSLPWIKLYHMGSQDRLTVFDGLFAFVSSMLLIAFLVFAFLNYNTALQPGDNVSKVSSRNLSNGLKAAFKVDIQKAFSVLSNLDAFRLRANIRENVSNISSDIHYQNASSQATANLDSIKILLDHLDVSEVFWLDRAGKEIQNFNRKESAPTASYADRSYYKQLRENRPYSFKDPEKMIFGLEQVVSWTTGNFTTVLSKTSDDGDRASYAAIAFNPRSMDNPLLPEGFTFAVADQSGKVLYHSDPFKNLNENLLEEFSETDLMQDAFRGNEDVSINTKYGGTPYNIYISPFTDLPYNLVIFEDTGYTSLRDTKVFVFTFSLLLVFYIFLSIHFLVIYLLYQRPSFLKKHYFDITWLGPNLHFGPRYLLVFSFNCVIILLLLIFRHLASFLQFLFILALATTAVSIFLNSQYKKSYFKTEDKFKQKKKAIYTLYAIAAVICLAAAVNTSLTYFAYFTTIVVAFTLVYVQFISGMRQKRILISLSKRLPLSHAFTAMVFTRLVIISALPVAHFFVSAYNYESSLIGVYRHKIFSSEFMERNGVTPLEKNANMFYDNVWIAESDELAKGDWVIEEMTKWLFEKLGGYIPYDTGVSYSGAQRLSEYNLRTNGIVESDFEKSNPVLKRLATIPLAYNTPSIYHDERIDWKGISYWTIFALALLLFVFLLHRVIRKLFALNLPKQTGWKAIDTKLLTENKLNSRLFMIGPPGSSILDLIEQQIDNGKFTDMLDEPLTIGGSLPWQNNAYIADMLMIPDNEAEAKTDPVWLGIQASAANKRYKLIIVNHFEYDLHNINTNRIKLNFLEALKQRRDCKIIIVSTVHPVNFLDSLNQTENKKPIGERQPAHDLERWHILLSHFRIIIKEMRMMGHKSDSNDVTWKKALESELRYAKFLNHMQSPVFEALKSLPDPDLKNLQGDSLAFKMEITSHYFYMSLWQSLTKEEKFILYDLAEDGLVNPYDDYNLTLLILKGIILQDDSGLRVFNNGFRHFILTSIGTSEVMKLRSQIRDNGTWNSFRVPFIIVIVAVFSFLFASQQEAYETLLKYLSVLTISVPTALKFFAMFEKTPKNN